MKKGTIKNYCNEHKEEIKKKVLHTMNLVAGATVIGFAAYFGGMKGSFNAFSELAEEAEDAVPEIESIPVEEIVEEVEAV